VKPDAFAAVMATGIVSIAAADHGYRVVSQVLLVVAAVALPVLVVLVAAAWRRESWGITDLDVALGLFTYVAACAVLGARLAGHHIALWVLGGMALQGWLSLAPVVARRLWRGRGRAHGGWELASVATSGLAIVSADLKIVFVAMLFWCVAIGVYLLMTGLVLSRAMRESSAPELARPDMWIVMGGAAIATLAGDHIHKAGLHGVWPVTVVTWIVATVWIPPLVCVAVRRRVGISWPVVFPLGMYSSATFAMFVETGWRRFTVVSLAFFWIALAAWVFVTASRSRALSRR
jgi:tellurite resistance protein TehA-like permease